MIHSNLWIILFLLAIAAVWFGTSNDRKAYYNQRGDRKYPYTIKFNNVAQKPNLTTNPKLADSIDVIYQRDNIYRVYSKVNDEELKKLIMDELGLEDNQVSVIFTRIFIPAFF